MTESYILFGIGLSSGISMSRYFLKYFKDNSIFVGALFIILIVNGVQIVPNNRIDRQMMLVIAFIQAFSIGILTNLQLLILSSRIQPHLMASSLEICFCFANSIAAFTPLLAKMDNPIPCMSMCSISMIGIVVIHNFHQNEIPQFVDELQDI
jgi:hypothetical protein